MSTACARGARLELLCAWQQLLPRLQLADMLSGAFAHLLNSSTRYDISISAIATALSASDILPHHYVRTLPHCVLPSECKDWLHRPRARCNAQDPGTADDFTISVPFTQLGKQTSAVHSVNRQSWFHHARRALEANVANQARCSPLWTRRAVRAVA